jgi:alpha-glucosidase
VADTLRLLHIPADVIWMDIDYMDHYKIFTFSSREFPDPKGLNDYLHDRNFKAVYMIDPGVKVEPGYFVDDQGSAGDYWVKTADGKPFVGNVWPGPCHFPDFTRQEVRTWWATLYKDYMATGIDGVWNDMNEPSVFGGPEASMPKDNLHGVASFQAPHLRYHNVYGLNMVRASREGLLLANPQKRPFILSRSNFLGGQRYAATWTGDNLSSVGQMQLSIPMSLTLGLSGQPFSGPDIGGFCENATAELVAQWTAQGVYFPFVRNHNIKGTRDQEPWAFDEPTLNTCRTAIERRYLLMPYIYTAFREASSTGMPVMRPIFMADAQDTSLRSEDKAFLLGGDLMVVPNWAGQVAMPKGEWCKLDLSSMNTKVQKNDIQAQLLQRPGSVIPIANLAQSTSELRTDSLTLMVCLDADRQAVGTLYEDAGDGFGYRTGDYRLSRIEAMVEKNHLLVSISKVEGAMDEPERMLRVGYLKKGKLQFTPWQKGPKVVVRMR